MSKLGYKTQSRQMLELDVPLGVTLINPFILQMRKLSLGEGTCQRQTAESNPKHWCSDPQSGAHFAPHPTLTKLERKGNPSRSMPSKLLTNSHSLAWNNG